MSLIYENEIKNIGPMANAFEGIVVFFGEGAPDEIKDFCYTTSVNPINGTIAAGQVLKFDDQEYKITAVGDEAPHTLAGLGHCSINFSGQTEVDLPGTIYVENKPMPKIEIGTKIQIIG
ncbi:MAG: PTS glucitol/sorbitol transporter subunit IIA [Lachnospiraceae bacterium]|nr:PTS glucitol/sorbitol transporter subunit IIA [Lachnospiraceae bacterium]